MSLLQARQLSRRFGGLHAVRDLDLDIEAGTVHAVIGPNGAGKSTLINLLTGVYKPSSGSFEFGGRRAAGLAQHRLAAAGIARTFQNIRLFRQLSVLDNVLAGMHARRHSGFFGCLFGLAPARREAHEARGEAMRLLDSVGLAGQANTIVSSLPYGHQRLVEVARALASQPKLLLLDEPAAGMHRREAAQLVQLADGLRSRGLAILLVEHNVRLVMDLADRVTVLHHGAKIAEGTPAEVRRHPEVVAAYLGEDNA